MFAHCPSCGTVFAINASHLRAAHGHVRCGACETVFDALERLTDRIDERPPAPPGAERAPGPAGSSGAGARAAAEAQDETPLAQILAPFAALPAVSGETRAGARGEAGAADDDDVSGARGDDGGGDRAAPHEPAAPPRPDGVPAALVDDLARGSGPAERRSGSARAVGVAVVLLLALGAQYAWFHPDDLAARYPQARESLLRLCAVAGCALGDGRDPGRIRVVTRAVRAHPRFEGALRVQAVVVNTGPLAQPYPRVRFSLFNVNGETIGSRVFEPAEYLPAAPAPGALLAPRTPLQIALDLVAPEDVAVSYEFRFL